MATSTSHKMRSSWSTARESRKKIWMRQQNVLSGRGCLRPVRNGTRGTEAPRQPPRAKPPFPRDSDGLSLFYPGLSFFIAPFSWPVQTHRPMVATGKPLVGRPNAEKLPSLVMNAGRARSGATASSRVGIPKSKSPRNPIRPTNSRSAPVCGPCIKRSDQGVQCVYTGEPEKKRAVRR